MAAAALGSDDLIEFLISNSGYFDKLSMEEKLEIKAARPTPPLNMQRKDPKGMYNRRFQQIWYTNFKWLTGNVVRNRLFCFYCILFPKQRSVSEWGKTGIGEVSLKNIIANMKKHESSACHIYSAVKFNLLGTKKIYHALSGETRLAAIKHNKDVDQNRLILRRLISTTCFLARQELPFSGFECDGILNKGNYLEILDFLAEEEPHMKAHLIHSTLSEGTSADMQNKLVECITQVVNELILKEVENAHFVSIQVDETTDVTAESKISVILRYANMSSGEVEERFVGFFDISENKTPEGVANVLLGVLKKWKIEQHKLAYQTYDGAISMTGNPKQVYTIIRPKYWHASFVHSYAHDLNLVLLHGGKSIRKVKLFIANLSSFRSFFNPSNERRILIYEKGFKLPVPGEAEWNFHSRGVPTILAYFSDLKAMTDDILQKDGWDSDTIRLAIGLKGCLNDLEFVFLLHLYSKIFKCTSTLVDALQIENIVIHRSNTEINKCLEALKELSKEDIVQMCAQETELLLHDTIKINVYIGENEIKQEETQSLQLKFDSELLLEMRALAHQILDNVIANMESRFQEFPMLSLVQLVNHKKFKFYNTSTPQVPEDVLKQLIDLYPMFNKLQLKGELMYIYGSEDKRVPPEDLFKFIINNNLKDVLPETFKLLSLILCIPTVNVQCKGNTSTLKRVKRYLRNSMANRSLSNLATLAIEKGLVKKSVSQREFISRIIDVFAEKTQRAELIYNSI